MIYDGEVCVCVRACASRVCLSGAPAKLIKPNKADSISVLNLQNKSHDNPI